MRGRKVVLGLAGGWAGLSMLMGGKIVMTILKAEKKSYEQNRAFDSNYTDGFEDYEHVWDRTEFSLPTEKAVISGEVIRNPKAVGERPRVAIICHGYTANRASTVKYAKLFYQLGYHLIIFDERYYGRSKARYCTLGMKECQDIAELIRFARETFGENAFIGLHGESMGGASVLMATAWEHPDFVVADCPFAWTKRVIESEAKKQLGPFARSAMFFAKYIGLFLANYDFNTVNPIEAVQETEIPICFIHGRDDSYITCDHSESMFKLCRNPLSELHIMPGAEHAMSFATAPEIYRKILECFVRKIEREQQLQQ